MKDAAGLYLHVPFCKTKCPYCDFYSITADSLIPAWVNAVEKEVLFYTDVFSSFDTLYLGGGTPSILPDAVLGELIEYLFCRFSFSPRPEITVEINPDDVTQEKLLFLKGLGFNRISLGAQSFCDAELHILKRRHNARQTAAALDLISETDFPNRSIDLICGLPGQTEAAWMSSLEKAVTYHPEHISCYQLTICKHTPFGRAAVRGSITVPDEEAQRSFFLRTARFLEGCGYVHYEVSNYARSSTFTCSHNRKYWDHTPYLGLGPSAHSFCGNRRWWNVKSVARSCAMIDRNTAPVAGTETLSSDQVYLESLALGFRTARGVDRTLIDQRSNAEIILRDLQKAGLILIHGERVVPTREGMLVADSLPLLFVSNKE
ncbi:MAG TPA: radical SAM family heme chaperone HemW [Thermodesulfobacteriota bacterium]|nr:radical SAM family heme chaperone HemW [Thermodesulfobacteriota bacterium]HOC39484.1 radical SAM family heme chaperone HemW [Thermodesulfobacteriota bacterium]